MTHDDRDVVDSKLAFSAPARPSCREGRTGADELLASGLSADAVKAGGDDGLGGSSSVARASLALAASTGADDRGLEIGVRGPPALLGVAVNEGLP